jgi:hypothetical protein
MNGGAVTNSFWDTTTSLQALSAGGAGVKGMPTADMKTQINFTSATPANAPLSPTWDFATIWAMVTDGATYPSLQICLIPATWAAVPAPPIPPIPPIPPGGGVPPGGIVPIATVVLLPVVQETVSPGLVSVVPGMNLSVLEGGVRMPPILVAEAPVIAPPPEVLGIVGTPPPPPLAVPPVVPPPVYVPPVRPRKPDRN